MSIPVRVLAVWGITTVVDLSTKWIAPVYVENHELTLGLGAPTRAEAVTMMLGGVLIGVVVLTRLVTLGRVPGSAAGLTLGGATGNLVDRVGDGAVTDFLAVAPVVVNVADLAVIVGVITIHHSMRRTRPPRQAVRRGHTASPKNSSAGHPRQELIMNTIRSR